MMTFLFVAGATLTAVACLVANLMSDKPDTWRSHLKGLARLGVIAACVCSVARVMSAGDAPAPERVLLMWSLAVLYLTQIKCEAVRQEVDDDQARRPGPTVRW